MNAFRPQHRDDDLAPNAYRVELRGEPRRFKWPALCPNCGARASDWIPVQKVFRRHGHDEPVEYRIVSLRVPFCGACIARHQHSVVRQTPLERTLSYLRSFLVIPAVGAVAIAALLLGDVPMGTSLGDADTWIGLAILAFFGLIFTGSVLAIWRQTRRFRVPPQTDVTLACDFSDDVSGLLEGERRVYAIRDQAFAEAFRLANGDRVWTEGDRVVSRRRQTALGAIAVGIAVVLWLWNQFGPT